MPSWRRLADKELRDQFEEMITVEFPEAMLKDD
jgi:hypothetical protein